jgi:hypothetical protein
MLHKVIGIAAKEGCKSRWAILAMQCDGVVALV